jgi:hypothetical protein
MRRNLNFRSKVLMAVVVCFALTTALPAQAKAGGGLPDLAIVKISKDQDCNLVVMVRNNGPGPLPDHVYTKHHPKSAGVYVYINGKGWGGISIWKFDPTRKLKRPGGQATCTLPYKVGPPIEVKAVVDRWKDIPKEVTYKNNTKVRKKLQCKGTQTKKLPDLDIVKIMVNRACNLVVVVKNNGPGPLPDRVYTHHHKKSAGVYVHINGKGWGGISIWKFDPTKQLQNPGGQAICTLPYKVGPPINVKAVVDTWDDVKEANEGNNTEGINKLSCGGTPTVKKPDLIVRDIRLIQDCKIEVTIANIGTAGVPNSYYDNPDAVAVQMYKGSQPWGGMILRMFDPGQKLQTAGGVAKHVWFPRAANLNLTAGAHSLKVIVDFHNKLPELNETNNTLVKKVFCKKGVPDLVVKDIRLIQDCKIEVTIANIGTAGVPDSYYDLPDAVAVQMYKGSQPWGGMILKMFDPNKHLTTAGGVATHVWFPLATNLNLTPGTHSIKVIADVHSKLTELSETNNTLTKRVTCKR